MYIVFIGPPGVGKGTQSRRLARHLNIPHLSTGDMLRAACAANTDFGAQVAELLSRGRLVPDQLVNEIVDRRLSEDDCRPGCLFDGFPRTLVQARSLDEILARHGQKVNLVLELRANEDELVRRMLLRATAEHRSDDSPETIRNRLHVYRTETEPLIGYYERAGTLQTVDGMGLPDEIFERITRCLPQEQRSH